MGIAPNCVFPTPQMLMYRNHTTTQSSGRVGTSIEIKPKVSGYPNDGSLAQIPTKGLSSKFLDLFIAAKELEIPHIKLDLDLERQGSREN
jgi:hypothetical protein